MNQKFQFVFLIKNTLKSNNKSSSCIPLATAFIFINLLKPLLQVASPQKVIIEEIPWLEAVALVAAKQPATPLPFKSVGPYLYHLLPDEGLATTQRFINEAPPDSTFSVFLHGLGGAVAKISSWSTAYQR